MIIASTTDTIRTINHEAYSLLDAFIGSEFSAHRLPDRVTESLRRSESLGPAAYRPLLLNGSGLNRSVILRPARLQEGWAILVQESGVDSIPSFASMV